MVAAHFIASPLAAANVLPISRVISSATTGISLSSSSAARTITVARSAKLARRHDRYAALARSSAASISWSFRVGYSAMTCSVVGLTATNGMALVCQQKRRSNRAAHLAPELWTRQRDHREHDQQHERRDERDGAHANHSREIGLDECTQRIEQRQRQRVEGKDSRALREGR